QIAIADDVAIGGGFSWNKLGGSTTARVGDHARIEAPSIDVHATTDFTVFSLTIGAGYAESFVFAASFSLNLAKTSTTAEVVGGATLMAVGGTVSVRAEDKTDYEADAGGVSVTLDSGSSVAIGVSFAWNDIAATVTARIDGANVPAADLVEVRAISSGELTAVTIAGAAAGSDDGGLTGSVAGAGSHNLMTNTVTAYLHNVSFTPADGDPPVGDVLVHAEDRSKIDADAGGIAVSANISGGGAAISVGGAFALNTVAATVEAYVESTVDIGGSLTVEAVSDADIDTVSVSFSGSIALGGNSGYPVALTGSLSVNAIANHVTARITNSNVDASTVDVTADDTSDIDALAGALSIAATSGSGFAGSAGISVAINDIGDIDVRDEDGRQHRVEAIIEGGQIGAEDDRIAGVTIDASSSPTIDADAIAGAIAATFSSNGGIAGSGAGAGTENSIVAHTLATIRSGAVVWTTGGTDISVTAHDDSSIDSNAGGLAISVSLASAAIVMAGAVSLNDIANVTTASVVGAELHSGRAVIVEATARSEIDSLALGLVGGVTAGSNTGVQFGAAGSIAFNTIGGTTTAEVTGGADIAASGAVTVRAHDDSVINGDGGAFSLNVGVSGGSAIGLGFAASVVENEVFKVVRAQVVGSTITNGTSLTVRADSGTQVQALSLAGVLGVGVSSNSSFGLNGAGAVAINDVHNTVEAIFDGSTVDVSGAVLVTASEAGVEVFSLNGGAADSLEGTLNDLAVVDQDVKPHDGDGNYLPDPINEQTVDLADDGAARTALRNTFLAQGINLGLTTTQVYVLDVTDPDGANNGADPVVTRWLVRDAAGGTYIVERDGGTLRVTRPALV
ncbi:MAG TPA: hypothetical protein VGK49_04155, partial [Ilumatobacteraceae bacterium]